MTWAQTLQELRIIRFERVYTGWKTKTMTQEQVANLLGASARTFRKYINRYTDDSLGGFYDKKIVKASHRRSPVDEILDVCQLYQEKYLDFNVKHFYRWYEYKHDGQRSYIWVKNTLQNKGSRYWYTPQTGGKVDKIRLTQFGQAMAHLSIKMIFMEKFKDFFGYSNI